MNSVVAEESFKYFEKLQQALKQGVFATLEAGMWLSKMREDTRFRTVLGDAKGSWLEFLAMPELTLTYSTANKLMRLYEIYKVKFPTADDVLGKISESKLKLVGPHLNPENQAKLLQAAATQTYRDLEITLAEVKRGVSASECKHEKVIERVMWQCQVCRERFSKKP